MFIEAISLFFLIYLLFVLIRKLKPKRLVSPDCKAVLITGTVMLASYYDKIFYSLANYVNTLINLQKQICFNQTFTVFLK